MRFNKLDLNLLVALDAMLKLRSISRAAEQLHISQSAMSSSLARLRDYFGDELLVQVGRQMELTPRAEVLKEAVRDVLVRVDTTIAAQPEFDPSRSDREFLVLVSDFTLVVLVPHLLRLVQRQSSSVRFQFQALIDEPKRALERGEADLLVIPRDYCSPDHPAEPLFDEGFSCVVWSGSRLAQRPLSVESYLAAGHIAMQPTGQLLDSFETRLLRHRGVARRVEVTSFSFVTVPYLLIGTERIATMHSDLARHLARSLPLTLLEPPIPIEPMTQTMQWHKYRGQDPGLVWLRGLLHEAVGLMASADAGEGPGPV